MKYIRFGVGQDRDFIIKYGPWIVINITITGFTEFKMKVFHRPNSQ